MVRWNRPTLLPPQRFQFSDPISFDTKQTVQMTVSLNNVTANHPVACDENWSTAWKWSVQKRHVLSVEICSEDACFVKFYSGDACFVNWILFRECKFCQLNFVQKMRILSVEFCSGDVCFSSWILFRGCMFCQFSYVQKRHTVCRRHILCSESRFHSNESCTKEACSINFRACFL